MNPLGNGQCFVKPHRDFFLFMSNLLFNAIPIIRQSVSLANTLVYARVVFLWINLAGYIIIYYTFFNSSWAFVFRLVVQPTRIDSIERIKGRKIKKIGYIRVQTHRVFGEDKIKNIVLADTWALWSSFILRIFPPIIVSLIRDRSRTSNSRWYSITFVFCASLAFQTVAAKRARIHGERMRADRPRYLTELFI